MTTSRPLRILVIHNRYQLRGGEDTVVDEDVTALRTHGHEVELLEAHNDEGKGLGRFTAARHAIWSRESARRVEEKARAFQPDVAHVHNHSYVLSASIFPELAKLGIPTVATLHNYRMTCSNAYLLRDGAPCELCVGKRASTAGITHACFRGSRAASAMIAGSQLAYRRSAIPHIARWLTPSEATRDIFVRADVPAERIITLPNAVFDRGASESGPRAPVALFVGRLSEEKGVMQLLDAWGVEPRTDGAKLEIVGEGPLAARVAERAKARPDIRVLGKQRAADVATSMRAARVLVVPSRWPETFGLVAVEAFAAGTPVIASDIGALTELVTDAEGWRAPAGDAAALGAAIDCALASPEEAATRGAAARARYERDFTMAARLTSLEQHYRDVISQSKTQPQSPPQ